MSTACRWPEGLSLLRQKFLGACPYPFIVVDNAFPEKTLKSLYKSIPRSSSDCWTHWGSGSTGEIVDEYSKRGISSLLLLEEPIADFLKGLNSEAFLHELRQLTGYPDLTADPTFNGGGLHRTGRGGFLRVHADKNRHTRPNAFDQAVNLILYVTPGWSDEYGGELELWSRDGKRRIHSIVPLFNRLVIFKSDRTTFHGHPEPLRCPSNLFRTSLAVYYYIPKTSGYPDNEILWK